MDAATLGAAAAAITSPKTTRCMVSMALSIAVDDIKTNYSTAKTLAMALRRALWAEGYLPAFAKAGERMLVYDDLRKECNAALDEVLEVEDERPWPTEGVRQPEIDEQAALRLYTAEFAVKMAAEEKACEEYGPRQSAMLQILDQINEVGKRIRIYPVCRARTEMGENPSVTTTCGISFPSCLWTRSENGHELICRMDWTALIKKLQRLHWRDPIREWARQMERTYGSHHNWPAIGCGASFYPTFEESTCVVEVQKEDYGWEAFAADPLPMEITDEIKQIQTIEYLPGPKHASRLWSPLPKGGYNINTPLSPPMTHHLQDYPIIARCPLEEWEHANRPNLSLTGWSKLAIITSLKGKCNFLCCFDITREPKQRTLLKGRLAQ